MIVDLGRQLTSVKYSPQLELAGVIVIEGNCDLKRISTKNLWFDMLYQLSYLVGDLPILSISLFEGDSQKPRQYQRHWIIRETKMHLSECAQWLRDRIFNRKCVSSSNPPPLLSDGRCLLVVLLLQSD